MKEYIDILKREISKLSNLNRYDAEAALEEIIRSINRSWQPVETCEYNFEEKVLISDGISVASAWMEINGKFYHYPGNQLGYYEFAQFEPKHWMPMPTGPEVIHL